jgi:hypothetical protein
MSGDGRGQTLEREGPSPRLRTLRHVEVLVVTVLCLALLGALAALVGSGAWLVVAVVVVVIAGVIADLRRNVRAITRDRDRAEAEELLRVLPERSRRARQLEDRPRGGAKRSSPEGGRLR